MYTVLVQMMDRSFHNKSSSVHVNAVLEIIILLDTAVARHTLCPFDSLFLAKHILNLVRLSN